MPKQTFFNLPEDKRARILEASLDEFAEKGYKEASVSRIVAGADIAKGSFYQYFEDKDDLYVYIVSERIAERKMIIYEEEKETLADLSLTEFLRVVFHRQLREFNKDPRLLQIALDCALLLHEPVYQRLLERYRGNINSYFLPFIRYEINQGEIDAKVNVHILNFMLVSLGQYLTAQLTSGTTIAVDHAMIDRMVDDLEYIFTFGIYGKAVT